MRLHALDRGLVKILVAQAVGIVGEPICQRQFTCSRWRRRVGTLRPDETRCEWECSCASAQAQESAAGKRHVSLPKWFGTPRACAAPSVLSVPLPRHPILYRSDSGVSPAFLITGSVSGQVRKRSAAAAASGSRAFLVTAPAKNVSGCTAEGIVATNVTPGT